MNQEISPSNQNFTPLKNSPTPLYSSHKFHNSILNEHLLGEVFLWEKTLLLSVFVFIIIFGYQYLISGKYSLYSINSAIASTSMILIGLSFALSGICYFWNFADSKIIYRKYLGIVGFAFAASHSILSFFLYPKGSPLAYFLSDSRVVPFFFGVSALLILLMMTLISNRFSIQKLGGKLWRNLLHLGYLAYFFVILHIIFLNADSFKKILPPTFFIIIILAILVLLLRFALYLKTRKTINS